MFASFVSFHAYIDRDFDAICADNFEFVTDEVARKCEGFEDYTIYEGVYTYIVCV